MIEQFNFIYKMKIWGDDRSLMYSGSGGGSEWPYNIHDCTPFMQTFIEKIYKI